VVADQLLTGRRAPRPNYGFGRRIRDDGYIDLWRPGHPLARVDGYVCEHRLVLHDAGLTVPDGFEVHHIDEDRSNNSLDNLAVLTAAAHHRLHHPPGTIVRNQHGEGRVGEGIGAQRRSHKAALGPRYCEVCGADITARRTDARWCSAACRGAHLAKERRFDRLIDELESIPPLHEGGD
jgi:hypothetical protein